MWIPKALTENEKQRGAKTASVIFSSNGKTAVSGAESFDNIQKIVPYGLEYVPPVGTTAVVIPVGNSQYFTGVVCQNTAELQPGELALYSSGGAKIVLKNDGTVVINGQVFDAEVE